jgi:hypothetical protein
MTLTLIVRDAESISIAGDAALTVVAESSLDPAVLTIDGTFVVPRIRSTSRAGTLRRVKSFKAALRFLQEYFSSELAERLEQLRSSSREAGARRLALASVVQALVFVAENGWPVAEMYATPSGDLQLVWPLRRKHRLAARFSPHGMVSFAIVAAGRIRLAGDYDRRHFTSIVGHLKDDILKEDVTFGKAQRPTIITADNFVAATSRTGHSSEVLQVSGFEQTGQTFRSSVSAQTM